MIRSLFFVITALLLVSCQTDVSVQELNEEIGGGIPGSGGNAGIVADIDGESFNTINVAGIIVNPTAALNSYSYSISSLDNSNPSSLKTLSIQFYSDALVPGSFPITEATEGGGLLPVILFSVNGTATPYSTLFTEGITDVGNITITNLDTGNLLISGTFRGRLSDVQGNTLTITNGSFVNVPYTVQ